MVVQDNYYRCALDKEGRKIHISEVNIINRYDGYRCRCCGGEMTPVLGQKNAHHFRHKKDACSYESYIHKIWKQEFLEYWHNTSHLFVEYYVEHYCDKELSCKWRDVRNLKCNNTFSREIIDLKEKYDSCKMEGVYGDYRADILLYNSMDPDIIPTFIEICYKSPCEDEKLNSGIPIIEIKVVDDNFRLPEIISDTAFITLIGFDQKKETSAHNIIRFSVYQDENGINHAKVDKKTLSCKNLNEHLPNSMMEVFVSEDNLPKGLSLFHFGIKIALKNGIKVRHCLLCRYYGSKGQTCLFRFSSNSESWLININDFTDLEMDKTDYTFFCRHYRERPIMDNLILETIPYAVWKNDSYERRQEKKPEKIKMTTNIDRLNKIALEHHVSQK